MSNQPRVAKVLAALLVSMTTGAICLMALSGNPPLAGPFSLSSYTGLVPVEKVIRSRTEQQPDRWDRVEVYYSGTTAGNIEQLASLGGLAAPENLNCHFVVCNGRGGTDGQILSTQKWQRQWSIVRGANWNDRAQAIRICVIADGKTARPTDCQIRRVYALVDKLCQKFLIPPKSIYYPGNWQ